jgi:serine/threonine protein kinase
MSRGRGVRTEYLPRAAAFGEAPIRHLKTSPAATPMIRDSSVDSLVETSTGCRDGLSWRTILAFPGNQLPFDAASTPSTLEDPESDISSASGRSSSVSQVSTPSSREIELISDLPVERRATPVTHRNTTFASQMHMSQFRQEQRLLEWGGFVQRLKERLPEKVMVQNEFFQLIDYGGSGSVYATAFKTQRGCDTLAIKVLRNKKSEPAIELPNEFQIMQGLQHNHVVAYVDAFSRKGQFAVLMYPVAICNLAEYLREASDDNASSERQHPVDHSALLTAIGCLSSAVMYLHVSRKIKHKDIKPENILFNRHGSVLLADFGISKQYEDNTLTEGTTPFTDKYAPPEVVDHDKRGLSTDVFSLGCVFLEMVTVILGETLEKLNLFVFESSDGQCYRAFSGRVGIWISQLKMIVGTQPLGWNASQNQAGYEGYMTQMLQTKHLDTILLMMSTSPHERPHISTVYETFKGFAKRCLECQAANVWSCSS